MDLKKTLRNLAANPHVALSLAVSALLALVFALFFASKPNSELLLVFLVASPPSLAVFYNDYLREKRTAQIEEALPSALFQLSSFSQNAPSESLVKAIASGGYGPLSAEFQKALRQMQSGLPPAQALQAIATRCNSLLLSRVVSLMVAAQESGGDASKAFRQVAQDAFKLSAIAKESAASATLQKYTLLAAGSAVIPLVLGMLFASTASFSSSSLFEFGLGQSVAHQTELRQTIFLSNQYYLAVFSLLASLLIAYSEGSPKKFVVYAAFLLPCSLLVFTLASGAKLF